MLFAQMGDGGVMNPLVEMALVGRFYHSSSATPMTLKEVLGNYDSDDDEDLGEWKVRPQGG